MLFSELPRLDIVGTDHQASFHVREASPASCRALASASLPIVHVLVEKSLVTSLNLSGPWEVPLPLHLCSHRLSRPL